MLRHHRRSFRTAIRHLNLDSLRLKPRTAKPLGNVCGRCGAYSGNNYHHSINCIAQLPALNVQDAYADLYAFWNVGYQLKQEPVAFPSTGTGVAYCMGRDCRGVLAQKAPRPALERATA